jgi:death on curing protein
MIVFGLVAVVIVVSVIVESPGTVEAVGLAVVFVTMIVCSFCGNAERLAEPSTPAAHTIRCLRVLAHGIAEGQPFIDGNKRTALVAMLTLLEINGFRVKASDRKQADWILSLGAGATPADLADILCSARAES